ncbi:MAG: hypothetical protein HS129_04845 [Leptospiraceae bacterium]|nr:hypothetical protein [Leptospiraceae bacterium]NUM42485.1 hypothetical protein [Leptospiraceae bacterium]
MRIKVNDTKVSKKLSQEYFAKGIGGIQMNQCRHKPTGKIFFYSDVIQSSERAIRVIGNGQLVGYMSLENFNQVYEKIDGNRSI